MKTDVDARRVALLARPGVARDRLSSVLDEAGALCVLAADPTELDPAALIELGPHLVVVALDPLTEEVLEQFDAVLGDPSVDVIYEEAEQAAGREGWDAARWQRHLVAKLQGHRNVLPPGSESSAQAAAERSGPAPEPMAFSGLDTPDGATEEAKSDADALELPTAGAFDPVNAEFDGFDADLDPVLALGPDAPMDRGTSSPAGELSLTFESLAADISAGPDTDVVAAAPVSADDAVPDFDFSFDLAGDDGAADGLSVDSVDDAGFAGFDPVSAETAVESPDLGMALTLDGDSESNSESDNSNSSEDGSVNAFAPKQELSLELEPAAETRIEAARADYSELHARISTLELVDDVAGEPPEQPRERGAVLILSGLGGPDAVRQLLGALPQGFTRPVLVRQHLDGGRYDRLVSQLQRATSLPVELAEPDLVAMPGTVYILPDSIGATSGGDGIRFCGNPEQTVLAALPSADSAVLLLSGSDQAHVDAAIAHGEGGALVAGQAADGCYDPAASNALAARGGDVASPVALALRLSARWSNQGSSNVQA